MSCWPSGVVEGGGTTSREILGKEYMVSGNILTDFITVEVISVHLCDSIGI